MAYLDDTTRHERVLHDGRCHSLEMRCRRCEVVQRGRTEIAFATVRERDTASPRDVSATMGYGADT